MKTICGQPTAETKRCSTIGGSLDPCDWTEFRNLSRVILDEVLDYLEGVRERPVWRPVPDEIKKRIAEPPPREAQGTESVCTDALSWVLPFATGNTHPSFFGWVHGSGTAGGVLAELFAAAMNANVGGRDHSAVYVERAVIDWMQQLFGFPSTASGLVVSGTSVASLIALTVARNSRLDYDVRRYGLDRAAGCLVGYTSEQAHSSVAKAFELLGLGRDALRAIPVDADFRIDLDALRLEICRDQQAGRQPFCVIGTAGTVNTGAIDDLAGIAALCAELDLWFHVDGAFGALAILHESLAPRLAGIEKADSLAFDFHKWLHVPYDAGCVLIRREDLHRGAFASNQHYLASAERGLAGGAPWFCDYGPELSRGFRALKVWFTLKEHGLQRLGEKIYENCRQASHLADLVTNCSWLELIAPVSLNIVCFRFRAPGLSDVSLDRLNSEVAVELQVLGIAAPSTTRVNGVLAIRANITNHRTRTADLDVLAEAVVNLGRGWLASAAPIDATERALA